MTESTQLLALHGFHLELGARMVPFAGYQMPVQYKAGLIAEHHHTRMSAGFFDVSHMGQIVVRGDDVASYLEKVMPIDAHGLALNAQRYSLLLNEQGGVLDDLMVIHREHDWLLIVNAACKHTDFAYLQKHIGAHCELRLLEDQALLALQGPKACEVLVPYAPQLANLAFMQGVALDVMGIDCYITRSGYSGEDGFEISLAAEQAQTLANTLLKHPNVQAVGLGARNSLRLEAGLCLYGNDLNMNTTPIEADLVWTIAKARRQGGTRTGGFIGAEVVLAQLQAIQHTATSQAIKRKRVALKALERIPVREPSLLMDAHGESIGQVSSGLLSPTLQIPIAFAYLNAQACVLNAQVFGQVRDRQVPMQIVHAPFVPHRYKR